MSSTFNSKKHSKKHLLYFLPIACIGILALITATKHYYKKPSAKYSLYKALDSYGFSSKGQKDALEDLMRQACILQPTQTIKDIFPNRDNYEDLVTDLLEFLKLTQKHFTIRTGHQERWEILHPEWMSINKDKNFHLLETLGMVSAIEPQNKATDALCILGGTMGKMVNRIDYASLLTNKNLRANNLILLAGERYVTVKVDGTEAELNKIAEAYQLSDWRALTETHLIQEAYKKSLLYGKIPTFTIDTPARDLPRPTTQTIILELIEWLKLHRDIKNIIFVSNQPYVKYQKAIIEGVIKSFDAPIEFEVIGGPGNNKEIQPFIEALGSYIFAQTPNVLISLGKKISDPEIKEAFKRLYESQPLIYHKLKDDLFN